MLPPSQEEPYFSYNRISGSIIPPFSVFKRIPFKASVPGQMLVFIKEADPLILAIEATPKKLSVGDFLGERFIWWNFVSSRKERI